MSLFRITPYGARVLVRVDETPTQTASGLHLPDTVRHNVTAGVVVAVGPGALVDGVRRPIPLRAGQRVTFKKYSGHDIASVMPDHLLLDEGDVLGTEDE